MALENSSAELADAWRYKLFDCEKLKGVTGNEIIIHIRELEMNLEKHDEIWTLDSNERL